MAAPTFVAATRPTSSWTTNGVTTKTSPSFSVTAGDVLVVLAGTEEANFTLSGATGGSLTWAQQENAGTGGSSARSAIWTATVDVDKSMTVSVNCSSAVPGWGFVVHQYRDSAGVGVHASTVAGSGAPSQALLTTQANSAISCINADWAAIDGATRTWRTINSITPTSGNGGETDYDRFAGAWTVYVGRWSDVGSIATVTTGISAPVGQTYTIAVVEIKGSGPSLPFDPAYIDWPLRQPHPKMRGAA
jgi:hypothetical protein